jgi:anaerobic magnesium-protoporphyrin IX monomethyl ester cyclase
MMPSSQVVFVFPRVDNGTTFRGFDYHLGSGYVRAYLESIGVRTHQFVTGATFSLDQAAEAILQLRPELVGFSCYDSNFFLCSLLALAIKRRHPRLPILVGGPSATFSAEKILKHHPEIDIAVRSYGEQTTASVLQALRRGIVLHEVSGVTWRSPSGEIICNHDRVLPTSTPQGSGVLDGYPDPYLEGLIPLDRVSDIGVVTSRGCSFPCTFCNFAAMSGRKVRSHTIERVLELLDSLESWAHASSRSGERRLRVAINDDNFSIDAPRMRQILTAVAAKGYKCLSFWAEMRVDRLGEEDFALLGAAGFSEINIGLDTAVPHVVRGAKKIQPKPSATDYERETTYVEKIRTAVGWAKSAGIVPCVSIILGLPGETSRDGSETLRFVSTLGLTKYAHNYIQVFDGTELAGTAADAGLRVSPYPGRILPLITLPVYPTFDLPLLDGDESQAPYRRVLVWRTTELLTGLADGGAPSIRSFGRGAAPAKPSWETRPTLLAISIESIRAVGESTLESFLPLGTTAWVIHRNRKVKASVRRALSRRRAPLQDLNFLEVQGKGAGERRLLLNRPLKELGGGPVTTVRLNHEPVLLASADDGESQGSGMSAIRLRTGGDVSKLLSLMHSLGNSWSWTFSPERLVRPILVIDACRWMGRTCPAAREPRLVMLRRNTVAPCFDYEGVPISKGITLDGIKEQFGAAHAVAAAQRRCETCVARNRCSQCFAVASFAGGEFCDLVQARPEIGRFVAALDLVRRSVASQRVSPGAELEVFSCAAIPPGSLIQTEEGSIELSDAIVLSQATTSRALLFLPMNGLTASISADGAAALRVLVDTSQAHVRPDVVLLPVQGAVGPVMAQVSIGHFDPTPTG